MQALVEYIAKALVESPDQVNVQVNAIDGGDEIVLHVAPEDRGRVIGKNGRTAHAIRTLLAAASPEGKTTTLEIVD
jgi:uncharacterized protein